VSEGSVSWVSLEVSWGSVSWVSLEFGSVSFVEWTHREEAGCKQHMMTERARALSLYRDV